MTVEASRVLAWDGCVNVRDLGGLPLEGGGETRFGVAVRADSIRTLSDRGWRRLVEYGIGLAIDLRGDEECADDPPVALPIEVVRFPVPGDNPVVREWPSMHDAYSALLADHRREFAGAVATVARSEAPVVIHCVGGRDRTGIVSALMLRLAGVPLEAIAADHAVSDESWAPYNEDWCAAATSDWERDRRRRILVPAGTTMADLLAELDVRAYLRAGGATDVDLDTLVVRFRR